MANATLKGDLSNVRAMLERLAAAPKHVVVGVIGTKAAQRYEPRESDRESTQTPPTLVEIATWNHFGTSLIPARPFFTETTARNRSELESMLIASARGIAYGKLTYEKAMGYLGQDYTDRVKDLISNAPPGGVFKENADYTIERKGSNQPLIDTGQLRGAITYAVREGSS